MPSNALVTQFDSQIALFSPRQVSSIAALLTDAARCEALVRAGQLDHMAEIALNTTALYGQRDYDMSKPFLFADGIAFIPITGVLLNRYSWSFSGATGYNCIRGMFQAAMADNDVKGIVFDVNSPGGMVQGCFELAEEIYAGRKEKPSLAMVDANAYSAAYALSSAAGRMISVPSGGIGSIGVVMMHVDYSKMLKEEGITIKLIYAGEHKVDGNPYEPLPDAVKKEFQADVNLIYDQFCTTVSKHRKIDKDAVQGTEARSYVATEALELKLVDDTSTPAEAISKFAAKLSPNRNPVIIPIGARSAMPTQNTETQNTQQPAAAGPTADESKKAERVRIGAILSCEEAKGRESLAQTLATTTELSVEECKRLLTSAPKQEAAAPAAPAAPGTSKLDKAMDNSEQPNLSPSVQSTAATDEKHPDFLLNSIHVIRGGKK